MARCSWTVGRIYRRLRVAFGARRLHREILPVFGADFITSSLAPGSLVSSVAINASGNRHSWTSVSKMKRRKTRRRTIPRQSLDPAVLT